MPFSGYDPSNPKKSLKRGKSTNVSSRWRFFCLFQLSKWRLTRRDEADLIRKFWLYHFAIILKQLPNCCHCTLIFVHCQVQSLCWPLCGEAHFFPNLRTTCLRCNYRPLLSNFLKISRSSDNERQTGEEEEGQEAGAEGGVEMDEKPVVLW